MEPVLTMLAQSVNSLFLSLTVPDVDEETGKEYDSFCDSCAGKLLMSSLVTVLEGHGCSEEEFVALSKAAIKHFQTTRAVREAAWNTKN